MDALRNRVRMSDQALVVVALARRGPGAGTVAHLLAAAAAEPEGTAGMLLRERETAAGALQARLVSAQPGLADLEVAIGAAARVAGTRPVDTVDLARAAMTMGAAELAELLESCGYDVEVLRRSLAAAAEGRADPERLRETMGFPPQGQHPDLTPPAARVVAKVRAVDGGAVDVVLALAATDEEPVFTTAEAEAVLTAAWRLRPWSSRRGRGRRCPPAAFLRRARRRRWRPR